MSTCAGARRWVQDDGQEPGGQGEDGVRTSPGRMLCRVHGRGNPAGQVIWGP
jgi:hypothetical protein